MPHKKTPAGDDSAPSSRKKTNRSDSGRDELLWLETYFIVFPKKRRPTLAQVQHALAEAGPGMLLENLAGDDEGMFQSLLVESSEDHAAVEISYDSSDAIIEQNMAWAKQLQKQLTGKQLQQIVSADARLEVAHFERVPPGGGKKRADESPTAGKPARSTKTKIDRFDDPADPWGEPSDATDDEFGDDFGEDEFGGESFDDDFDADAALDVFDPTCLLTVVEALAGLTKGITFDPAAGEVV